MALYQVSATKRDADNKSFLNYAGRMMVGSYNIGNSMNWVTEQELYFGYSTVLAYKNYFPGCSNLFVGGVNDWKRTSSSN